MAMVTHHIACTETGLKMCIFPAVLMLNPLNGKKETSPNAGEGAVHFQGF